MEVYLKTSASGAEDIAPAAVPIAAAPVVTPTPVPEPLSEAQMQRAHGIYAALCGPGNVLALGAVAITRLRVRLADPGRMDTKALAVAGVQAVMTLPDNERDLIVGLDAAALARALAP
jgi:PTS system glucose-specific IIC component